MTKRKQVRTAQTQFNLFLPSQINPEPFLNLSKPQPSRALVESALFQLELGTADVTLLYKSVAGGDEYSALLRWGYSLVSKSMSSGEIMNSLHQLAFTALAAGWISCESGVQTTVLNQLVSDSTKASSGLPKPPKDGSKPGRKVGEQ
jgi:hypothetical protein